MSNQSSPTRVRIYSHITQSRFLHVEDALAIGKLRLFGGNYRQGAGMTTYAHAYVDIADARVIFGALARGEQGFSRKEYKGTPDGQTAVSRVLSVAVKGDNVYVELKSGPGKLTPTGAITPNGPAEVEVNVAFKLYEARRLAASVLAYLHAWDVMRMLAHQRLAGQPSPYLLVAAGNGANGVQPGNGAALSHNGHDSGGNGRPVTRKDPAPARTQPAKPTPTRAAGQPLKYGDGSLVDGQNFTEVQTFQRYKREKKAPPASKTVLLAYYRQHGQAVAGAVGG
jgi:hypothetical protein